MKKVTRIFSILLAFACLAATSTAAFAQDYDDDLYYSPSKAKKEEAKRKKEAAARQQQQQQSNIRYQYAGQADYAGSDAYTVSSSRPLTVDVDTYNRRGSYTPDNTASASGELGGGEFENTRRIERFHNSDVVTQTGDTTLMQYYYSQPQAQNINVYVVNSDPWDNWAYRPAWRWRFGSPYWSFGWGYDPWFDWTWGYDPFWGPFCA